MAVLTSDDIVGGNWTFHYDNVSRRVRLMPMVDVSQFAKSLNGPSSEVIFDSVRNVLISSREDFVIGECKACEIRQTDAGMACAMAFDDFGADVKILFEFQSFRRP